MVGGINGDLYGIMARWLSEGDPLALLLPHV